MKSRKKGIIAALFSTLFFSSYAVLGKWLLTEISAITLLAIAQAVSVLMLIFFFGLWPELKAFKKLSREQWAWVVTIGLLSGVVAPLFALIGLQETSAVNAVMLGRLEVVAAGLIAVFWLKEKVSRFQLVGAVLMFLGVAVIATEGFSVGLNFSGGDGFVIAGALLWAIANVFFRRSLRHLKPEIMVLMRNTLGGIALLLALPFFVNFQHDFSSLESSQILLTLLAFSAFSIILGQFLWYRSLELISTTLASSVSLLMPLFGVALAVIILKEQVLFHHLWGGAFVVLGLVFTVIHRHKHPSKHHSFWQRLFHGLH